MAKIANRALPTLAIFFGGLGHFVSFYLHFFTVGFIVLTLLNFYLLRGQKTHALLHNFGILAQARYILESIGPEFRQYLYSSDTEERPFNRVERSDVYRKAKGIDSSAAFGSQREYDATEIKLRHSLFPVDHDQVEKFELRFGEERGIKNIHTITKPIMISAMSYGSLGSNAVRALARGAKKSEMTMNTGEGGYPKYHLMEECDLTFQLGTAKFGVRHENGDLDESKLESLCENPFIKMVEIKLSQGAKPGKGGLLPKEKITDEIAELRGVGKGYDVVSPAHHSECKDAASTVKFVRKIQEVTQLPVGIKLCYRQKEELRALLSEMIKQNIFPDYVSIDGGEGGTGAAPKGFMDDVGVPLFAALPIMRKFINEFEIENKFKLICAGKLINPTKQFMAMSMGAHACYSARGFLLAIGCIQALQCNKNTCPAGITTHVPRLQDGLDIELKSDRVYNYVKALEKEHLDLLAAIGKRKYSDLSPGNLFMPTSLLEARS